MKKIVKPPVPADLDCSGLPFPVHEILGELMPDISPERRAELVRLARKISPSGIVEIN